MNLLIIFVIIIIFLQFVLFLRTWGLIRKLKKTLSGDYSIINPVAEEDSPSGVKNEARLTLIGYHTLSTDKVSENIINSLNSYLMKNRGAVSDFHLIKDIVERNSDAVDSEITSQTPLPLYLGLMGTVAGIVLGLFTITMNEGFSNIENVIGILMSDVAVAMVASFMGIGFTTFTLYRAKQGKATVEENKNRFYTWIQINLLPVISRSAVSSITLLQQNLNRFNQTFTGTVERLDKKLGDVGDVYESQIEILDKIEAIDVKKMAAANVKILSALDSSMGNLERFSQYMGSVTEYLTAVRELNEKLDDHFKRTEALEIVADFYKKQMHEIDLRQSAIKEGVTSVDNVMKSALSTLQANSEQGLRAMQETFINQMATMQEMASKQTEKLASQIARMPQMVQKLEEISEIPSRLDKLINRIEKANNAMVKQVQQTVHAMPASRNAQGGRNIPSGNTAFGGTWFKWGILGTLALIAIACIANLIVNIAALDSGNESIEEGIDSAKVEIPVETIEVVPKQKTESSPRKQGTSNSKDIKESKEQPKVKKEPKFRFVE